MLRASTRRSWSTSRARRWISQRTCSRTTRTCTEEDVAQFKAQARRLDRRASSERSTSCSRAAWPARSARAGAPTSTRRSRRCACSPRSTTRSRRRSQSSTSFLLRLTRRELDALDLRLELSAARADPRDPTTRSRPATSSTRSARRRARLSECAHLAPGDGARAGRPHAGVNKIYISLNRFLADRHVLPEIKAALRIRSEHRPAGRPRPAAGLQQADGRGRRACRPTSSCPRSSAIRTRRRRSTSTQHLGRRRRGARRRRPATPRRRAADRAGHHRRTRRRWPRLGSDRAGRARRAEAGARRVADPRPADGARHVDAAVQHAGRMAAPRPAHARWRRACRSADGGALARCRSTSCRTSARRSPTRSPTRPTHHHRRDRRCCSTTSSATRRFPQSLRSLFGRLQVPIVKVALLDRTFFSDKTAPGAAAARPPRRGGDRRAERRRLPRGLRADGAARSSTRSAATSRSTSRSFGGRRRASSASSSTTSGARPTNRVERRTSPRRSRPRRGEADRSSARALIRDKLAGLDLPFEVRCFAETIWADYLATLREGATARTARRGRPRSRRSTTCCGASSPRSAPRRRRGSPR